MHHKISDIWAAHCHGRYPREFSIGRRFNRRPQDLINDTDKLTRYIEHWNTRQHQSAYTSVYAFSHIHEVQPVDPITGKKKGVVDYGSAVVDTIFNDLDSENDLDAARYDAMKLIRAMHDNGIRTRLYFSGAKGFALYVDFKPFTVDEMTFKSVISIWLEKLRTLYHINTLDDCVKDGMSRVSRIPNTLHPKSNLYCVPVEYDDLIQGMQHIKQLAEEPRLDIDLAKLISDNTEHNTPVMHTILKEYVQTAQIRKARNEIYQRQRELDYALHPPDPISNDQKCPGVLHAEQEGITAPGREPTAVGLLLAYKDWHGYPKEKTIELLKVWCANKCNPPREGEEWLIVLARINKFYGTSGCKYKPCYFLRRYGHCKGVSKNICEKFRYLKTRKCGVII